MTYKTDIVRKIASDKYQRSPKGKANSARHRKTTKRKVAQRRHELKKKYGMTLEDYDKMLEAQNGTCAICKQLETHVNRFGSIDRLSVDHNHETSRVRGLLCRKCNLTLMGSKEGIKNLLATIQYLTDNDL